MTIKIGVSYFVGFCLISCGVEVNKTSTVVQRDGAGNIISEEQLLNGEKHGLCKYYFWPPPPRNQVEFEIDYSHGKVSGWEKKYLKNGKLIFKKHFLNNVLDGESVLLYEDGKVYQRTFWLAAKQFGSQYIYFKNGRLANYASVSFFDKPFYVLVYDSTGIINKLEGFTFSRQLYISYAGDTLQRALPFDSVKCGKSVIIRLAVAQPPQCTTTIKVEIPGLVKAAEYPIKQYACTIRTMFPKPGKYLLTVTGEIKDKFNELNMSDTVTFAIVTH